MTALASGAVAVDDADGSVFRGFNGDNGELGFVRESKADLAKSACWLSKPSPSSIETSSDGGLVLADDRSALDECIRARLAVGRAACAGAVAAEVRSRFVVLGA